MFLKGNALERPTSCHKSESLWQLARQKAGVLSMYSKYPTSQAELIPVHNIPAERRDIRIFSFLQRREFL
jgi:hypothetical protein